MTVEHIPAPNNHTAYEQWAYAPATRVNGLVFVSGQVGLNERGEVPSDPETQITLAFENLQAVLAAAGCGFKDVVEITSFHVEMHKHIATMQTVKARYIKPPYAAWTAVGVTDLAVPGLIFEIRAIAKAP